MEDKMAAREHLGTLRIMDETAGGSLHLPVVVHKESSTQVSFLRSIGAGQWRVTAQFIMQVGHKLL